MAYSTDIKDYYRRAWGLGDRVPFQHGGTWADWKVNYEDQMSFEEYLQDDVIVKTIQAVDKAEGGRIRQLVTPSGDGLRPGYAGKKLESGKKGVTINGKQYRKITNPTHPKFGKISFPTSKAGKDITEYLTVEEVKNRVKGKKKIYTESLDVMAKKNIKISQKLNKDINSWASNWFKNNQSKYAVRDFDKFSKAFEKAWKNELAANSDKYKGFMSSAKTIKFTPEGLPAIKDAITIDGIQFPQRQDASLAWKKLFYKSKLKDKNFNAKVNKYLDWNLTKKWAGGAGSMPKTAALDYGKLIKGIDDEVVFFMGEVLNNRALNPGGGQTGINDVFKKSMGKKADAYFKKYQGSWGRWTDNFYSVAKLAGLDQSQAKALLQKQINDTQKIMKAYNVKKLPLEFMVAQDHIMGLAEAKHLGDPKIAAQTLKNLVASTREQNRVLGQHGFSNRRVKLMKEFNAAPKNARQPIVNKINALAKEFVPGKLKYDVRPDGSLKITPLQPETSLKAKKVAYEKLSKEFPKNIQKVTGKTIAKKTAKSAGAKLLYPAMIANALLFGDKYKTWDGPGILSNFPLTPQEDAKQMNELATMIKDKFSYFNGGIASLKK